MKPTNLLLLAMLVFLGFSSFKGEKKNPSADTATIPSNSITGIVKDHLTGETLTGVEVIVEGTQMKTYTDFNGKFVFDGVKPGTYRVTTNYISYKCSKTPSLSVKTNELHSLNIALEAINE